MRITESQLRRIVRQEILREQGQDQNDNSQDATAAKEVEVLKPLIDKFIKLHSGKFTTATKNAAIMTDLVSYFADALQANNKTVTDAAVAKSLKLSATGQIAQQKSNSK